MKRYDLEFISDFPEYSRIVEQPDGDWVDYDEAQAEIDRLKAGLLEDLDTLKALNAELVVALERFAEFHTESCGWIATGRDACDCGVDEARAALKKARGE